MAQGLFRKYGESLLDQPIGLESSRVRQAQDFESRNNFQNDNRAKRIARQGYRYAMKNKDFAGAQQILRNLKKDDGLTLGSGIGLAGVARNQASHRPGMPSQQPSMAPQPFSADPPDKPDTHAGYGRRVMFGAGPGSQFKDFINPSSTPSGGGVADPGLNARLGLFGRMKDAMSGGKSLNNFWDEAKGLGVTPGGFGNAMDRARKEVGYATPPDPSTLYSTPYSGWSYPPTSAELATPVASNAPAPPANPNSPAFDERTRAQGNAMGLWDRNNLV